MKKSKRMNYKDDFEMIYLRHEYLEKTALNGDFVAEMAGIVNTTAKIMFDKLRPNFEKVSFNIDDVVSVTNVYMLGYMALYSIRTVPQQMEDFLKKNPHKVGETDLEFRRIDRNRLISFLRQKLVHCGLICARKARNITVGIDKRGIYAETDESVRASDEMLLEDYQKYGYRKVTNKEYRAAKLKATEAGKRDLFDQKGFKIVKVEMLNNGICEDDYKLIAKLDQSVFLNNPETALQMMQEELAMESYKTKFSEMSIEAKKRLLNRFINRNSDDSSFKHELKIARKVLEDPTLSFKTIEKEEEEKREKEEKRAEKLEKTFDIVV